MRRKWKIFTTLVKSFFTCVHLSDTCTADEFVRKVSEDEKTETWNCWCTCKCGEKKLPKTLTFDRAYLDQLRSVGLM